MSLSAIAGCDRRHIARRTIVSASIVPDSAATIEPS